MDLKGLTPHLLAFSSQNHLGLKMAALCNGLKVLGCIFYLLECQLYKKFQALPVNASLLASLFAHANN